MCILCELSTPALRSSLESSIETRVGSGSALLSDALPGANSSRAGGGFRASSNATESDTATGQVGDGTTDIILDFDGGFVQTGQGYELPTDAFNGFTFSGYTPFNQNDGTPGDANEQILQIIAGVREDYADFNVRVIWDDQGVNSPFYDNNDTVIMIVGDAASAVGLDGIYGIAASVDIASQTGGLQAQRDTGFAFLPTHVTGSLEPVAYSQIRELIDTVSHEVGHTFGLSHSNQADSERRQIVTTAGQNQNLDSRFSSTSLNHGAPETGVFYSEVDRLIEAIGAAAVLPGDTQSGQTLPNDPATQLAGTALTDGFLSVSGAVNFLGDRDAFRFQTSAAGRYTIRQTADATSNLVPVVTLWDAEGDFIGVSTGGALSFDAIAGATYYAVAGSESDRQGSGVFPVEQIGAYVLDLGNSTPIALDDLVTATVNETVSASVLANDSDFEGSPLTTTLITGPANGSLTLNPDGSYTYTPNPDFSGSDSFVYQANDGLAFSALATVSLTINALSVEPTDPPGTDSPTTDPVPTNPPVESTPPGNDSVSANPVRPSERNRTQFPRRDRVS